MLLTDRVIILTQLFNLTLRNDYKPVIGDVRGCEKTLGVCTLYVHFADYQTIVTIDEEDLQSVVGKNSSFTK